METRMYASRVEQRLAELVAFDTRNPGGDERALAEHLAAELRTLGASHAEVIPASGHFSAYARFGTSPPPLMLNAHLDTVPANAGTTSDPLVLVRRDRRREPGDLDVRQASDQAGRRLRRGHGCVRRVHGLVAGRLDRCVARLSRCRSGLYIVFIGTGEYLYEVVH